MPQNVRKFYEFANFRLDVSRKILLCGDKPPALTPKVFDTLEILIENGGNLPGKDELMRRIWHDHFVEKSNLTSTVKMLRNALGDDAANPRFIETVPRRGYRFIAEVSENIQESAPEIPRNNAPGFSISRKFCSLSPFFSSSQFLPESGTRAPRAALRDCRSYPRRLWRIKSRPTAKLITPPFHRTAKASP